MVHLEFWQAPAMGNKTSNNNRKNNIKQHSREHQLRAESRTFIKMLRTVFGWVRFW